MAPLMAKTFPYHNFQNSPTPGKENKTVKLGNQTVMTLHSGDGTGIIIGPEIGLVGVQREWGESP